MHVNECVWMGAPSMCSEYVWYVCVCVPLRGTLSHSHTKSRDYDTLQQPPSQNLPVTCAGGLPHPHQIHGPFNMNFLEAQGVSNEKAPRGPGSYKPSDPCGLPTSSRNTTFPLHWPKQCVAQADPAGHPHTPPPAP